MGSCSPAVGVQRSEDSGPGVHILQHGSLFGACRGVTPRQLAELSREAVLNVQGLGIALSSLLLLQRLHLYMFSQLHFDSSVFCLHTDWRFHAVVMVSCFGFLRQLEEEVRRPCQQDDDAKCCLSAVCTCHLSRSTSLQLLYSKAPCDHYKSVMLSACTREVCNHNRGAQTTLNLSRVQQQL